MKASLAAGDTGEILKLFWFMTQVRNEDDVVTVRLWLIPKELWHLWGAEGTSSVHFVPVLINEPEGKLILTQVNPVLEAA